MLEVKEVRKSLNIYLLIPISLMAEAGGPINITPSFSQSSANSGFSDKKPYPG